jgi:hypothetical protein
MFALALTCARKGPCAGLPARVCAVARVAQPLTPDEALANTLFLAEVKRAWGTMRRTAQDRLNQAVDAARQRFVAKAEDGDPWTAERETAARARAGFMQVLRMALMALYM